MSFTQPICSLCYGQRHTGREPLRIPEHLRSIETCCVCGKDTKEGIYYRVDPNTVSYPREGR